MGGACGMQRSNSNVWSQNLKGSDHLEDLNVGRSIILNSY